MRQYVSLLSYTFLYNILLGLSPIIITAIFSTVIMKYPETFIFHKLRFVTVSVSVTKSAKMLMSVCKEFY